MSDIQHFDEDGVAQTRNGTPLGAVRIIATAFRDERRAALDGQIVFEIAPETDPLGQTIQINVARLEPFEAVITRATNGRYYFRHTGRFPEGRG